jgi:glycerate 2-kinase
MKVLIAMDSFKGNLSSINVAHIVAKGIKKIYSDAEVEVSAVADGGEGTIDALLSALGGELYHADVSGPLGLPVTARYAVTGDGTAVIETAEASGLGLLAKHERNPLLTTTFGTGQLICRAIERGCRKIILAIGGSATNDGGTGIAKALGVRFCTDDGRIVPDGGGHLSQISKIDLLHIDPIVSKTSIIIISDVANMLLGDKGASRFFSPQKGADPEMAKILEQNMKHYSDLIKYHTGRDVSAIKGTGAAGGTAASMIAFFDARICNGADFILDSIKLEDKIKNADIVITGEGRIDSQTAYGKLPIGVAKLSKKYAKPVYAIAGFFGDGYEEVFKHGIDAAVSSMVGPMTLDEAMIRSHELIENAAANLFRIILAAENIHLIMKTEYRG